MQLISIQPLAGVHALNNKEVFSKENMVPGVNYSVSKNKRWELVDDLNERANNKESGVTSRKKGRRQVEFDVEQDRDETNQGIYEQKENKTQDDSRMYRWMWKDENQVWRYYTAAENAAIQTNREKSASMHVLCSNGQAYIIDTAQGFQRNKEYGTEKLIKCVLEANVPAGTNISSANPSCPSAWLVQGRKGTVLRTRRQPGKKTKQATAGQQAREVALKETEANVPKKAVMSVNVVTSQPFMDQQKKSKQTFTEADKKKKSKRNRMRMQNVKFLRFML